MVNVLNRNTKKPRLLQNKNVWIAQTDAAPPPPSITVDPKTVQIWLDGNLTTPSYTVAVDDIVVFPICTNTNFGDSLHTITKSSGTATIGSVTQEALQQTGGQSSLYWCRVTGAGTIVFSISTDLKRTAVKPYVLTGCDTSDCIGAETQGGAATNDLTTTAVDAQASASVIIVVDTEWNDLGDMTSSDLQSFSTFNGGGTSMSGCFGHRVTTAPGNITANLNANGSGTADHDYCQVEFLVA